MRPKRSRLRLRDDLPERGRRVPAGRRRSARIRSLRGRRSRSSGRSCRSSCPPTSTRARRARSRRRRGSSAAQLRVVAPAARSAGGHRDLLDTWDCESKIIQKWWADIGGREEAAARPDRTRCMRDFRADDGRAVSHAVAAVRLSPLGHAAHAGARARRRRAAPANSLNYGDLLNLAARCCARTPQVRRALQQKYRHLSSTSSRTPTPSRRRSCSCWRPDEGAAASEGNRWAGSTDAAIGARPASPRRALRRRRSEAVDLSLPPRRHRDLQHRPRALRASLQSQSNTLLKRNNLARRHQPQQAVEFTTGNVTCRRR